MNEKFEEFGNTFKNYIFDDFENIETIVENRVFPIFNTKEFVNAAKMYHIKHNNFNEMLSNKIYNHSNMLHQIVRECVQNFEIKSLSGYPWVNVINAGDKNELDLDVIVHEQHFSLDMITNLTATLQQINHKLLIKENYDPNKDPILTYIGYIDGDISYKLHVREFKNCKSLVNLHNRLNNLDYELKINWLYFKYLASLYEEYHQCRGFYEKIKNLFCSYYFRDLPNFYLIQ